MVAFLPLTQRMMLLSIVTAVATVVLKFAAWKMTGSIGLFSDAAESLVNVVAALFGLFALRVSALPPDDNHAFGHEKIEYMSAAIEGTLIMVAAGAILYSSVSRLLAPRPVTELGIGLGVSAVASVINGAVAVLMLRVAKAHDAIVLEADAHHLLADVWTSLAIIVGLLLVMALPHLTWLDPVIAILVALNILRTALELIRRATDGLMDVALPPVEVEMLQKILRGSLPEGSHLERLRTRKSGSRRFVEFVLLVPGAMSVADSHAVCDALEDVVRGEFPGSEVLIHVEPAQEP